MEKFLHKVKQDHPGLRFNIGQSHCWSPERGQILYVKEDQSHSAESLLHEVGHARLGHEGYVSDLELLQKEVEAWQEAEGLAGLYGLTLDDDHIQDCLDTYRDWLHKRSTCPQCLSTGIQDNDKRYLCLNCGHAWSVSVSRFCRPYRRSKITTAKSPR